MSGRRYLGGAAMAALLLAGQTASACGFHGATIQGVLAAHPASIKVALATRSAIDAGLLQDFPAEPDQRRSKLLMVHMAASQLVLRAEREKAEGPAFSVLFIESGLWLRFDGTAGATFHAAQPPADATTIILADAAFAGLLFAKVSPDQLAAAGALVAYGGTADLAISEFVRLVGDFRGG